MDKGTKIITSTEHWPKTANYYDIYGPFTVQLLESGHLEEDYPITSFLKQKMLKFFFKKNGPE